MGGNWVTIAIHADGGTAKRTAGFRAVTTVMVSCARESLGKEVGGGWNWASR